MTTLTSRDAFYETGLAVLSELGYAGLKLAEVCARLKVTSGSFYHYFANWADYTAGLLGYWFEMRTVRIIEDLLAEGDPRARLAQIVEVGLTLPHGAERAIRTWSNLDPRARQTQKLVDQKRFDVVSATVAEISEDPAFAEQFAYWSVFLLVGYEQTSLAGNRPALREVMVRLLQILDEQSGSGSPALPAEPLPRNHTRRRTAR
ncbi:TetR/AcrR family transcriptional regulator [Gordonia sp. NPDC003376]